MLEIPGPGKPASRRRRLHALPRCEQGGIGGSDGGSGPVHKPPSPSRCPKLPRRTRRPRPRRAATTPNRERRRIYKNRLHDLKTIHMSGTTYRDSKVKEKGAARSADTRADRVSTEYAYKARKLDDKFFEAEPDANARPIAKRLNYIPESSRTLRGSVFGTQLRHPRAAAGDGQVRSKAQLAQSRCHFSRNSFRNLQLHDNLPQPMGCRNRPAGSAPPALKGVSDLLSTITPNRQGLREHIHRVRPVAPSDCTWYAAEESAPIYSWGTT